MNSIDTIILGIIQGLTEFLPVSSSGHLVIFQNLLGFKEPELLLDCSLHMGTLMAVCLYFRFDLKKMAMEIWQRDLKKPHASLFLWIMVGSVPTGLIGLSFKTFFEKSFGSITIVGAMLIATGIILAATRFIPEKYNSRTEIGLLSALAIGTAQSLAIMPGLSRSGATIACGLLCGLNRDLAARFSFLLSIPAIIGALALQINLDDLARVGLFSLVFGFVTSAIVGFLALKLLMGIVRKGHFAYFAPYCWAVGMLLIFVI